MLRLHIKIPAPRNMIASLIVYQELEILSVRESSKISIKEIDYLYS